MVCERGHITNREVKYVCRLGRCKECYMEDHFNGSNNYHYKHGKSRENMTERQKRNNECQKWRRAVFKLKGQECDICGSEEEEMHAHHLNGYEWDINGRFDPENGIPLCEKHHWEFHNEYGRGGNTKEQYDEYKKITLRKQKVAECYSLMEAFVF